MRLPNAERAVVDMNKLRDYCLSAIHPRGKHKARVFASALGLTLDDAEALREFLLSAARQYDAVEQEVDAFGARFTLDAPWPGTSTVIRSLWIVRADEDFPRLATCYVV
jgi:hypothetical protein